MPRWPLRRPAGHEGGADAARGKGGPRVTHFRLSPSGLPGTPTLLTTTISGARAVPRPRPRPPPACHLPPGRIQEGRPRLRACHPLPPRRPARPRGRAPRSRKRAARGGAALGRPSFPQARSTLSRRLAFLRLALGRGLLSFRLAPRSRPCLSQAYSPAAVFSSSSLCSRSHPLPGSLPATAFLLPGSLSGRRPSAAQAARVLAWGLVAFQLGGRRRGGALSRPPRPPLRVLPRSSARLPPRPGAWRSPDLAGTAAHPARHPELAATTATVHRWYRQWPSYRPMCL